MNRSKKIRYLFAALLVLVASAMFAYEHFAKFNPQNLVKNSKLSKNNFAIDVQEIISTKYGIKAYLFEDNSNPIISINFIFAYAGSIAENHNKLGLANIAASIMGEAAGDYDSQEFKQELENYAISLGYTASKDSLTGSLLTIKSNKEKAFELLRLSLMEPRVDKADLSRIKQQALIALEQQNEQPQTKLSLIATQKIYGDHAYGKNPLGSKDSIMSIGKSDVLNYINNNLGKDNLFVGISGDISKAEAEQMLDDVFGGISENGAKQLTNRPKIKYGQHIDISEDIAQNISMFVTKGTTRLSRDFYPLYVANYILGGSGLNSRLNKLAREDEGLTYGIYTSLSIMDNVELISGSYSSTQENFARVGEIVLSEWQKIRQNGVSQKELNEAKDYLVASYNLRFADISVLSEMLAYMQKDKLGIDFLQKRNDYIKNINLAEVNQVANKYFNPDNLIIINMGRFNTK